MSILEIIVSNILIPYWKPISFALLISGSAIAGWKANTYYTGYQESIEQQIAKKVDIALDKMQQENTKSYLETKKIMEDNTKVIETKVPYIVEREVYKNVCLDEDGVKVLNELKQNSKAARNKFK
ncbi:hypothetical protein N0S44_000013 [Escherichia coli]|uniref:hypothetical protein n=1 Tax=Escherichia coli TaxID=562 RepID=UPI0021FEBF03|nr:hypothetical protein [Escherichia coli]EJR1978863.1 hypothetical protein [Escherichia coli]UTS53825.1 hypothetical protein UES1_458 [Escherichia phage UE-S1]